MTMYKCSDCGHMFEDGEERIVRETCEVWGQTVSREEKTCPHCGCDVYEETEPCKSCGRYLPECDLYSGYCESCLLDEATTDTCYAVGAYDKEDVAVNSFFAYIFDESEIDVILYRELKRRKRLGLTHDCEGFVKEDIVAFADRFVQYKKEMEEKENAEKKIQKPEQGEEGESNG